jgi:hypothetical protein
MGVTASMSVWVKTSTNGSGNSWTAPGITGAEESGTGNDIFWGWMDNNHKMRITAGNGSSATTTTSMDDGTWRLLSTTRNSASGAVEIFVNGASQASATSETGSKTQPFNRLCVIMDSAGAGSYNYFNGSIDEFRSSNTVRAADWFKAEYLTQAAADSHLTYAAVEAVP